MAFVIVIAITISLPSFILAATKHKSANNKPSKAGGKPSSELFCGVCEVMVAEVEAGIAATTEKHEVQTRFRVDEKKRMPYARTEYRIMEILENDIATKFSDYGVLPDRGVHGHQVLAKKSSAAVSTPASTTNDTVASPSTPSPSTPSTETVPSTDSSTPPTSASASTTESATTGATADVSTSTPTSGESKPSHKLRHSKRLSAEMKRVYHWMLDRYQDDITLVFHRSEPNPLQRVCNDIIGACHPVDAPSLPGPKTDL